MSESRLESNIIIAIIYSSNKEKHPRGMHKNVVRVRFLLKAEPFERESFSSFHKKKLSSHQ